jgi:hypothetical protein
MEVLPSKSYRDQRTDTNKGTSTSIEALLA